MLERRENRGFVKFVQDRIRNSYGTMNILNSPEEILRPDLYLNQIDLDQSLMGFAHINVAQFRRAAFIDARLQAIEGSQQQYLHFQAASELKEKLQTKKQKQINYIFHSAFCCSTLLSKCMDVEGVCMTLKEPSVIMQLANYKRTGHPSLASRAALMSLIELTVFYLSSAGNINERIIIKPTNAANNIAGEIMESASTGSILLLYSGLERFLVSVIKKGEECRAFVRKLFNIIKNDSDRMRDIMPGALVQMTDLQIAALVWNLQIDQYLYLLKRYPQANIRTLDCDVFLESPAEVLQQLYGHFACDVRAGTAREVAAGPVFSRYSKNQDKSYSPELRESEYAGIRNIHRKEIDLILSWSDQVRPDGAVKLPLPRALL